MDVDDKFYDEISSFMPQPQDYGLNDIDDLIGSTVTQLDSTLDLNNFALPPAPMNCMQTDFHSNNDFESNLSAFPSPASTTNYASVNTSPSTSSSIYECDYANLDEFFNFINDDDMRVDELTCDSLMKGKKKEEPERNTPSPTGSCSSSSGSSTSGVHSDSCSSVSSSKQQFVANNTEANDNKNKLNQIDIESTYKKTVNNIGDVKTDHTDNTFILKNGDVNSFITPTIQQPTIITATNNVVPLITLPTVQTPTTAINLVPGTLIPVVPSVPLAATTVTDIPAPIKAETKLPATNKVLSNSNTKISSKTNTAPALAATSATGTVNLLKCSQPVNTKLKTIILSRNEFKALMQKMNTNGKGAKINGSVNTQMPKIIMKIPNGKVITTNKIMQPMSVANVGGKIVKANVPPALLKQQQQQSMQFNANPTVINSTTRLQNGAATMTTAVATNANNLTATATANKSDLSFYKGLIDEKMFKKQQRMIKNREAASLSRKKKKEYVASLETRINNLEKENYSLKRENTSLRNQLVAFAKACNCRHGNVSEFVLNTLNTENKNEHHHVRIAPKPSPKSLKQRMTAATFKKNVAVLFAMAFMVTLNVGGFQNYMNKQKIEADAGGGVVESIAEKPMNSGGNGRRLLWVETEQEYHEKMNRNKRAIEMDVPPLHFLRPVNRTGNHGNVKQMRNYDKANELPLSLKTTKEEQATKTCNGGCAHNGGNHTENQRLASNLHKWIGGNDYLNLSLHTKYSNELDNPHGFKLTMEYMDMKNSGRPLPGKRKIYMDTNYREQIKRQKYKTDTQMDNNQYNKNDNSLKLFEPKIENEYLRLFKGIKRQDDTFYVLSFNMDHILLPASAYSKNSRPKMSLMLPAGDPTINGDVVLMKIDCEVFNTTQLELKSHMIPTKLRPQPTTKSHDVTYNETDSAVPAKKTREKMPLKYVPPKEKPPVHTYFMVGPKTQAAAAASMQKPRIVKLRETHNLNNMGIMGLNNSNMAQAVNVKNLTLFAKLLETVEGEFGP